MNTDTGPTSTIAAVSDQQLLHRTKELARHEHHLQIAILDHLQEIESRCLHLRRGFSSLFDYAMRELRYSEAAAWRRIKAMRLCARTPGARARLDEGTLTLSAAAQLQHAFERQERSRTRRRPSPRGTAAAESVAAPPDSPPAAAAAEPQEAAPTPLLDVSARQALVDQAAGRSTRQVMQLLARVDPELAVPAERLRALGDGRFELKVVIDAECQRGLERLKGLLSHVDPAMTNGELVGRLVAEGLARHDPGRPTGPRRNGSRPARGARTSPAKSELKAGAESGCGVTSAAKSSTGAGANGASPAKSQAKPTGTNTSLTKSPDQPARPAPSAAKSHEKPAGTRTSPAKPPWPSSSAASPAKTCSGTGRAVPTAIKREVWQRDGGCCSYVDPLTKRRCKSLYMLQIDHIQPYALGGRAEPDNLRLLCAAHHRHRHGGFASPREPAD